MGPLIRSENEFRVGQLNRSTGLYVGGVLLVVGTYKIEIPSAIFLEDSRNHFRLFLRNS